MKEMQVWLLSQEDLLEKEMAAHSSILAWEIPWMEEPGGLQSMELQKSWTRLSNWTTWLSRYQMRVHKTQYLLSRSAQSGVKEKQRLRNSVTGPGKAAWLD